MIPFRDNIPSNSFPVVVYGVIVACVLVFFHTLSLPSPRAMDGFIASFALVPAQFTAPAAAGGAVPPVLRLGTSLFLHGGWLHLLGNMLFLWIFGDNVEDAMGHGPFLAFYLICGVVANLAHIAANPLSREPTIGASGAIAGVLGAYLVRYPRARVQWLVFLGFFVTFLWLPAVLFLPLWIGLQLLSGLASLGVQQTGGVAWWAHIGGFFTGVILVRFFVPHDHR